MQVPDNIQQDMQRIKAYYPFRIVFCVYDGESWEVYAKTTRHVMNNAIRKGYGVWSI